MLQYQQSLFIFRRDLRLVDNTALNAALRQSAQVIVAFNFDPRQICGHPYQSRSALQFMLESLQDLQQQLATHGGKLYLFNSLPETLIDELHKAHRIEAVFVNHDYTPFSRQRDQTLQDCCKKNGIAFHSYGDILLNEPNQVLTQSGTPYQVFTAFYQNARQIPVALPQPLANGCFVTATIAGDDPANLVKLRQSHQNAFSGGRNQALQLLQTKLPQCGAYSQQRDFPSLSATSQLSAYLKFGCCSVREAFYHTVHEFGEEHPLLRQFYWRDFFSHVAFHHPYVFGHAFQQRFDQIGWSNDQALFQAWITGKTGFPIIDAAMRELTQTGWMHNRLRMIVASFLTKDLHISWRWGERYFAQQLLDYDPCVNNGNWQWAASTGCDAQPYFRIFNPWLQQRKFDPDCAYIKHWLPELQAYSAQVIHNWQHKPLTGAYPAPLVEHATQSQIVKTWFKNCSAT